jgi:hypothetical protein
LIVYIHKNLFYLQLKIIKSQRGGDLLIHENFIYTKGYECFEHVHWRCQNRSCRRFLLINSENNEISSFKEHNHKNEAKIQKLEALHAIKEKAL